jgi:cytochrome oxidase Cu insertion factor (SCO1/SenC/PrrC family)
MRRGLVLASTVALVALSGAALAAAPDFGAAGVIPYDPPKPALPLALPDLDGKTVRLEDFRGKALLLFFWATW